MGGCILLKLGSPQPGQCLGGRLPTGRCSELSEGEARYQCNKPINKSINTQSIIYYLEQENQCEAAAITETCDQNHFGVKSSLPPVSLGNSGYNPITLS